MYLQRVRAILPRRLATQTRSQSTSFFAAENLKTFVPSVKLTPETTLGEIYEQAVVKYKYRLIYPILLWSGFLWYNLWTPYMPDSEKEKIRAREQKLKSLEFHQK